MYQHAPPNYICPICCAVRGEWSENIMIRREDIVYQDASAMALINSKFILNNPGHVIIVSTAHYENIYELPDDVSAHIAHIARRISLALKAVRNCEGVTVLQNNEPASEQHAFHYHMHVIPRFPADNLYQHILNTRVSEPSERVNFARELRHYLQMHTN